MALQGDFEGLCRLILHCTPLPSVDSVVNELLVTKIHLKSQAVDKGILLTPNQSIFSVPSRPSSKSQQTFNTRVGIDECSFYKQKGH